ncbi:thymidine kinase [Luteibaculum oceani]|uniref:Thymidine kinase n=1 Tax=Luteibaculum oceani TaxID=1294296 RepID=A0A5C6V0E6_9FLAO|nr:thymidine kinase [Luteibaculum oceani]TXC78997.1 thymidine kinase [Luteibaculum oceani]
MGRLEFICGPMFSGKTEELLRRVKRAELAQRKVACYKSKVDNRYDGQDIVSHNKKARKSVPISSLKQLQNETAEIIAIDEVQFFDAAEIEILNELAFGGKIIIAAGLDMDFTGKPFPASSALLAIANKVLKLTAICMTCGEEASYSRRLGKDQQSVLIGAGEKYEPRCRKHFR